MATNMIPFTTYLSPAQLERLRTRHAETGAALAEIVRRALDAYLPPAAAAAP